MLSSIDDLSFIGIQIARYIPENFYTDFNLDANNLEAITTAAPSATTQISTQTAATKLSGATASPLSLSLANGTTILQVRETALTNKHLQFNLYCLFIDHLRMSYPIHFAGGTDRHITRKSHPSDQRDNDVDRDRRTPATVPFAARHGGTGADRDVPHDDGGDRPGPHHDPAADAAAARAGGQVGDVRGGEEQPARLRLLGQQRRHDQLVSAGETHHHRLRHHAYR